MPQYAMGKSDPGTLHCKRGDSAERKYRFREITFFFSFFFSQYLTRMISGVVEKIWLAVQEKGPIDDDMKEQR